MVLCRIRFILEEGIWVSVITGSYKKIKIKELSKLKGGQKILSLRDLKVKGVCEP